MENRRKGSPVVCGASGLLSLAGYVSSSTGAVTQLQSAVHMIINNKLDKKYPEIMRELVERESRGEL